MPQSNYPIYPSPTTGSGTPYGMVPGPIGMPNPYADLAGAFPELTQANKAAGTDLLAQLGGNISPGTRNALQLASAQFGTGSGMPLSGLSQNQLFGNIAGFSEALQQRGLQNYNQLIPTISKTQTVSPELQTEIAARNALYAAAPDPNQAANLAQKLFDSYLNNLRGPGGGGGGAGPQQGAGTFRNTFANTGTGSVFGAPTGPTIANDPFNQLTPDASNIGNLGPAYVDWTTGQPPQFEGPSGGGWGGGGGGAPYNPLEDFSYNPFTAGGGVGSLLPDYTNPLGIGNIGDVGGGGGGGGNVFPDWTNPVGAGNTGGGGLPVAPSDDAYWNAVLGEF